LPEVDVSAESLPEYVRKLRARLNRAQLLVMSKIESRRLAAKALAQEEVPLTVFEEGAKVLLYIPQVKPGKVYKLTPHWIGPFIVHRRALNDKVYYLRNVFDEPLDHPVSINRLKPFHERGNGPDLSGSSPPGLVRSDVSGVLADSSAVKRVMEENGADSEEVVDGYRQLFSEGLIKDNSDAVSTRRESADPFLTNVDYVGKVLKDSSPPSVLLEVSDTPANRRFYHDQYDVVGDHLVIKKRVAVVGKRRVKPSKRH